MKAEDCQESEQQLSLDDPLCRQARSLAALQERERLARELHDNIAQALGYLNLQISITSQLLANGQVEEARVNLASLERLAGETYTDLREEIFSLRTTVSSGMEFLDVLRDYLEKYRTHYGLEVDLLLDNMSAPEFDLDVGGQILRIIQEALINVRKHARVNQALIRFAREKNLICISIEDRGQGFDLEQGMAENGSGFGLQIMRERVKSIGGHLEIQSAPNAGSRLMVQVPAESGS